MNNRITPAQWGERALAHATQITNASPGRGSATQAEAQAAGYVRQQLSDLGLANVRVQPFQGLRSIWLFLSLAFGTALVGHAAFWLLRRSTGVYPALAVSMVAFAFSAYLLWRKLTFRDYPLRRSLPHGPSQNVIAVIPPAGEVLRKVVLVGHLDSHRVVWWFAADFLVKLYALSSPPAIYGLGLAPLLYTLAALTQIQVFAWVALAFALLHFLAWFTGVTADLGPYSPGANDNAAAVGTVLALAERLLEGQSGDSCLQHTEVWLALTGCEESGCDGMLALLDEYGEELQEALFLNFELVGIGERLVYLQSEGVMRKRRIPANVERLVLEVGQQYGLQPTNAGSFGVFTETGTLWEHGFQGVCLLAQRQDSPLMPEWHRLTDRPDRLQAGTLSGIHDLAWDILQQVDAS